MTATGSLGRIVIVGAGLAGGSAAVALRDGGFEGQVVVVGDEPVVPFGRPPLSKAYLRGEEDLSGWEVKPADWYPRHGIDLRLGGRVSRLEPTARRVVLEDGTELDYDRLLLATGGRNRRFAVPGADLPGVLSLRTVAECDAIRAVAKPGARIVVVGMGFIGSEVAASLRTMGVDVTVVLPGREPLSAVLGQEVAGVLGAVHRERGVELVTDDQVVRFEGTEGVERVVTEKGTRIPCDAAVVAIGIQPNVDRFDGSGLAVDNGILVDGRCQTSLPDIYAAGDVANHLHPVFGRLRVEHYNNAEHQGRAAALSILDRGEPYQPIHSFWSDQYDTQLEYAGFAREWDRFVVRGSVEERRFLGFYLVQGVVRAVVGFNRGGDPESEEPGELKACTELIRNRVAVDPSVLEDEDQDLGKDLAHA